MSGYSGTPDINNMSISHPRDDKSRFILSSPDQYPLWKTETLSVIMSEGLLAYIISEREHGVEPILEPTPLNSPVIITPLSESSATTSSSGRELRSAAAATAATTLTSPTPHPATAEQQAEHDRLVDRWQMKNGRAYYLINQRVDHHMRPRMVTISAREYWHELSVLHEHLAGSSHEEALFKWLKTTLSEFGGNVIQYISAFSKRLQELQTTARTARVLAGYPVDSPTSFRLGEDYIVMVFLHGIEKTWLTYWKNQMWNQGRYKALNECINSLLEINRFQNPDRKTPIQAPIPERVNKVDESKSNANRDNRRRLICKYCKGSGHIKDDCWKLHPEKRPQNSHRDSKAAAASDSSTKHDQRDHSDEDTLAGYVSIKTTGNLQGHDWILDTGAGRHFCNDMEMFEKVERITPVHLDQAVGSATLSRGGTVRLKLPTGCTLRLENVLYSPKSSCNLISAGLLYKKSNININTGSKTITKNDRIIGNLTYHNNLLILQTTKQGSRKDLAQCASAGVRNELTSTRPNISSPGVPGGASIFFTMPKETSSLWHQRLAHASSMLISKTAQSVTGLEHFHASELNTCTSCNLSKSQRIVSREQRPIPPQPLDEVHADTVGPIGHDSDGHIYFTLMTCMRTKMRWVILARSKDEISSRLMDFVSETYNAYDKRIKIIFTDNGTEFGKLSTFCRQHGIRHDVSAPYTPEQNGVAEAANKVIITRARSMLIEAKMPPMYWGLAIRYAVFISNRICRAKGNEPPMLQFVKELRLPHKEKLDLTNIRKFGAKAFKAIPTEQQGHKFAPRAEIGWFMGFQKNSDKRNYMIMDSENKISVTPHVQFDEDVVWGDEMLSQYQQRHLGSQYNDSFLITSNTDAQEAPEGIQGHLPVRDGQMNPHQNIASPSGGDIENMNRQHNDSQGKTYESDYQNDYQKDQHEFRFVPQHEHNEFNEFLPVPKRTRFVMENPGDDDDVPASSTGGDENLDHANDSDDHVGVDSQAPSREQAESSVISRPLNPSNSSSTRSPRHQIRHDYKQLNSKGLAAKADISYSNPESYSDAITRPDKNEWIKACNAEIESLQRDTFEVIPRTKLPAGRTPLTGKWVLVRKTLHTGEVDKYKARWCARGFTQKHGDDYIVSFAPTPRQGTARIMQGLTAYYGWHVIQMDVESAFLNADLDIDLYIEMPEGYEQPGKIIKLKKSLYGLKQAAALWYDHAKASLIEFGFKPSTSDVCLYVNKSKDTYVLLHVDDMQLMGNKDNISRLVQKLQRRYKMKAITSNTFLGNVVTYTENSMRIDQSHYTNSIIKDFGLEDSRPIKYPLQELLHPAEDGYVADPYLLHEYQSRIGKLNYLAVQTRPDIAHATNHLARFLANPTSSHLAATKQVARYLVGTKEKGIVFDLKHKGDIFECYCDADFAGDPSTSRSTSGILITLCSAPVIWRSKLQGEVVQSSTEAEYLALNELCREINWIRNLLTEIGLASLNNAFNVHVDNKSTIQLAENHDNHKRSKHVALRNHYCREQALSKVINIQYIESTKQLADTLTKPRSNNPTLVG